MTKVTFVDLPLPPFELASRVGSSQDAEDPWRTYEALGEATRLQSMAALPTAAGAGAAAEHARAPQGQTSRMSSLRRLGGRMRAVGRSHPNGN